jgi:hypothetical protein
MTLSHKIYIFVLSAIVAITLVLLIYTGYSYYRLDLGERVFNPDHAVLKPGGSWGHGMGIAGSLCMIFGILLYSGRKRMRSLSRIGVLKHWLEFHIFLCTLGPVLVLFHTSFKFGGLVAVSFWSMVAVFVSGIIGRFIYIQIPRTIEGRELTLSEVRDMKTNIGAVLKESYNLDPESHDIIVDSTKRKVGLYHRNLFIRTYRKYMNNRRTLAGVRAVIKKNNLAHAERKKLLHLVKHDITLNRKIDRLVTMQNLFRHWHVAHFPFAIVMMIIMVIHAVVTIVLGYRWIF